MKKKGKKKRKQYDGIGPERMPDEFFAEQELRDGTGQLIAHKGDFNLAQVQGEKARQYFERVLGLPMPPNMVTKSTPEDEGVTQGIRNAYNISAHRPVRRR